MGNNRNVNDGIQYRVDWFTIIERGLVYLKHENLIWEIQKKEGKSSDRNKDRNNTAEAKTYHKESDQIGVSLADWEFIIVVQTYKLHLSLFGGRSGEAPFIPALLGEFDGPREEHFGNRSRYVEDHGENDNATNV